MKTQNESSLNTSDMSQSSINTTSNSSVAGSGIGGRSRTKKKRKKAMRKKKLVLSKKRKKNSIVMNQQFKNVIKEVISKPSVNQAKTLKNEFEDIYLKNEENFIIFYSALKEELANSSSSQKSLDSIIQNNIFSKIKNLCIEVGREIKMDIVEHEQAIGYWKNDEVGADGAGKAAQGISAQDVSQNQKSQGSDSVSKKFITLISATDFTALIAEVKKKVLAYMGKTIIECAKDNTLKMTDEGIKDGSNKIVLSKDKVEQFMINSTQASIDVGNRKVTVSEIQKNDNLKVMTNLVPNELKTVIRNHGMIETILIIESFFERFNCSLWDVFGVLFKLMKASDLKKNDHMILYQSFQIVDTDFLEKKQADPSSCLSIFANYKDALDQVFATKANSDRYKQFEAYIKKNISPETKGEKDAKKISDNMRIQSFYYLTAVCGLLIYIKNHVPNAESSIIKEVIKALNKGFFGDKSGKDRFREYATQIAYPMLLKNFDSISFDNIINSAVLYNHDFSKVKFDKDNFRLSCDQMVLTYYLDLFSIIIQIEIEDDGNVYFMNEDINSYFNDYFKQYLLVEELEKAQKKIEERIKNKIDSIVDRASQFCNNFVLGDFRFDDQDSINESLKKINTVKKILDAFINKEFYENILNNIPQNNVFVSDQWSLIKDFYLIQNNHANQEIYSNKKIELNVEKTLFKAIFLDVFNLIKDDLNYLLKFLHTEIAYEKDKKVIDQKINTIKTNIDDGYKKFIMRQLTDVLKDLQNNEGVRNELILEQLYDIVINTALSIKLLENINSKINNDDKDKTEKINFINTVQKLFYDEVINLEMLCMQLVEVMYLNPLNSKYVGNGVLYGAVGTLLGAGLLRMFAPGALTAAKNAIMSGVSSSVGLLADSKVGQGVVVATAGTLGLYTMYTRFGSKIKNSMKQASTRLSKYFSNMMPWGNASLKNASF
jgi:hypothetical protein